MQTYKIYAVKRFTNDPNLSGKARDFYTQCETVLLEARGYYDVETGVSDDEFKKMIFVDSCFLLNSVIEFLNLFTESNENIEPLLDYYENASFLRDMMLVENQIPFKVLNKLLSIKNGSCIQKEDNPLYLVVKSFVRWHLVLNIDVKLEKYVEPVHLLDLFRKAIIGKDPNHPTSNPDYDEDPSSIPKSKGDGDGDGLKTILGKGSSHPLSILEFVKQRTWAAIVEHLKSSQESVTKLKHAGIICRGSKNRFLGNICFENRPLLYSCIWMPRISIDDETKCYFLNMIACEISGHGPDDRGVVSYMSFMNKLIHGEADIKELRARKVIMNASLTDKQLMDFFNGLAKGLVADPHAYIKVKNSIRDNKHSRLAKLRVKFMVSLQELYQTYFRNPWAMIGLIAAGIILFLTAVQTYYTVFLK